MDIRTRCAEITAAKGQTPEPQRLAELIEAEWAYTMEEFPEHATAVGYAGFDDRWSDSSLEAIERRKGDQRAVVECARGIDASRLQGEDLLNLELFLHHGETELDGQRFPDELFAIGRHSGPQSMHPQLLRLARVGARDDVENLLARLEGLPPVVDETIALLQEGIARGITPPRVTMERVPDAFEQHLGEPEASPLLEQFGRIPDSVEGRDGLRARATDIVRDACQPAYRKLLAFFTETYLPACRTTIALRDLPDGEAWYDHRVRLFTTTRMSAKEIHDIGQAEVARIRREMEATIERSGFEGSFDAFNDFLRTDDRFFFDTPEALLSAYRAIAKRADPELIRLFGTLPRLPYGVEPVPPYLERTATTAYYWPGSPEAGRPGLFYANTYDLRARPSWEMEALTLHEAVPGHHLQLALAAEMTDVPEFRKHGRFTAYTEGWGLYSESLGEELGFYTDPYSKFGQLTYEMWRAIRLVVDTGMHALGWERERALDLFRANTGKAEHDIAVEVDRYIEWPGQALAYKIGELKFKELRARATAALGPRFDVRAFHDAVLRHGALPLAVLDRVVDRWIDDLHAS